MERRLRNGFITAFFDCGIARAVNLTFAFDFRDKTSFLTYNDIAVLDVCFVTKNTEISASFIMPTIKTKRVYEKEAKTDGCRVLVDRLWPRGVKKESLHYDLWEKDVTPSSDLRKWYHEDLAGHWSEFAKKYRKELEKSDAVKAFLEKIKTEKTVTLLYAAKDETQNHALILQKFLESKLK